MTPTQTSSPKEVRDMVIRHDERINEIKEELKFHVAQFDVNFKKINDEMDKRIAILDKKVDQILIKVMLANTLSIGLLVAAIKMFGS